MQVSDALQQITEIRAQVTRATTFRGYRAATVAFSGITALAAAGAQTVLIPKPQQQIGAYLALWVSIATVNLAATAMELWFRCRRLNSTGATRGTLFAVEQFVPCVAAGALATLVLARSSRESVWMLPGLWSILFSLGVFASSRLLPRGVNAVGAFYLVAGVCLLSLGAEGGALSPWSMGVTFGMGQLSAATILYLAHEHPHER